MKYFEFGKENPVTLMLLHGVNTTWKLSFADFIEVAKHKYHFAHKVFLNRGHGSLLLEPERMLHEVDLAYKGYKGRIRTK